MTLTSNEAGGAPKKVRNLTANLLLMSLSSAMTLLLAEAALRVEGHHLLSAGEYVAAGVIFRRHDDPLGFSLEPDRTRFLVTGGAYTTRDHINSQGMRDVEHRLLKPPDTKRILVLGDSFMFGQGVAMEENLSRRLAAAMPGVEVINAGVPGFNLGQEYLLYKDRGYRYQPDLVLLSFFIDDLGIANELVEIDGPDGLPVAYHRRPELLKKDTAEEAAPHGMRAAVAGWLKDHSLLYTLARMTLIETAAKGSAIGENPARRLRGPAYLPVFRSTPDEASTRTWDHGYRILDDLSRSAASSGARLALILIPAPWQTSDEAWREWTVSVELPAESVSRTHPQEMVKAWCARSGTPCLDLLDVFWQGDLDRLYFHYDLHWTPAGHDLAARTAAAFLEARKLP